MQRYDKAPTLIPRGMVTIGECGKYVLWTDYCMLKVELSDALSREAALQERVRDAENILLLHRDGKHGDAQVAYMDYCGKYLGEPSRG